MKRNLPNSTDTSEFHPHKCVIPSAALSAVEEPSHFACKATIAVGDTKQRGPSSTVTL
jgi:hypothetical protein